MLRELNFLIGSLLFFLLSPFLLLSKVMFRPPSITNADGRRKDRWTGPVKKLSFLSPLLPPPPPFLFLSPVGRKKQSKYHGFFFFSLSPPPPPPPSPTIAGQNNSAFRVWWSPNGRQSDPLFPLFPPLPPFPPWPPRSPHNRQGKTVTGRSNLLTFNVFLFSFFPPFSLPVLQKKTAQTISGENLAKSYTTATAPFSPPPFPLFLQAGW